MIWLLAIPIIFFMTFRDLVGSDFPDCCGHDDRGFLAWAFLIAVGCFISCLISAVPFGIAAILGSLPEVHGIKDREYPLVALRQQDGVAGHFYFLGAGFIADRQYYFWYRRDGDSVQGGKTIRVPGVRIYEGGADASRMVTFKTEYKNQTIGSWFWLVALDLREQSDWLPDFHIPPNSIKEGFSL